MLIFYLSIIEKPEDKERFKQIYYKYRSLMFHIAHDILSDEYLAEDVIQNVFLKIISEFENLDFSDENKTKSFIAIITKNTAISEYRKRKKELYLDFEREMNVDKYFTYNIDGIIDVRNLADNILRLPDIYKDVLVLKFFNEFTNKEVSRTLNISEANVRKRMERAKIILGVDKRWVRWK